MVVAQLEIRGGLDLEMRALKWLYGSWLPRSGYVPDDQPCFEAWIGRPFAPWNGPFRAVRAFANLVDGHREELNGAHGRHNHIAGRDTYFEYIHWVTRISNRPRPKAVASGRPTRGGRLREVAPLGALRSNRHWPSRNCSALACPRPSSECSLVGVGWRKHAGSLEALWVTRPKAVGLARTKPSISGLTVARSAALPVFSVCRHGYMTWARN